MGRLLAIDYGQKRVGLAVTDELQIIATPLDTVPSGKIIEYLKDYTVKNKVECFVVGDPRQMDNTPSESVKFIDPFIRLLKREFSDIPVERMDERFTSLIASDSIRQSGVKKKERRDKSLVDKVSATLILQSYLESKSFKKAKK
jgi:putative holliday junction resolvase